MHAGREERKLKNFQQKKDMESISQNKKNSNYNNEGYAVIIDDDRNSEGYAVGRGHG